MKVEESLYYNKLFDSYGKLLSKGQQEIMSAYLIDDLTVSEIAQNMLISRQAVLDSIRKAEIKLEKLESELGFVKKIEKLEEEIERLKNKIN